MNIYKQLQANQNLVSESTQHVVDQQLKKLNTSYYCSDDDEPQDNFKVPSLPRKRQASKQIPLIDLTLDDDEDVKEVKVSSARKAPNPPAADIVSKRKVTFIQPQTYDTSSVKLGARSEKSSRSMISTQFTGHTSDLVKVLGHIKADIRLKSSAN